MKIYSTPAQYQCNNQIMNFRGWKSKMTTGKIAIMRYTPSLGTYAEYITPAKDYKELGTRLKKKYLMKEVEDWLLLYRLFFSINALTKKILENRNIYKELIENGYDFTMKNKDNLDELTKNMYTNNRTPFELKGMLKALKELGLIK